MLKSSVCEKCDTLFNVGVGSKGRFCSQQCYLEQCSIENKKKGQIKRVRNEEIYLKRPNVCMQCLLDLPYNKRSNKFCSSSCAATFNNTGKIKSRDTKDNISIGVSTSEKAKVANNKRKLSRVKLTCPICKISFIVRKCEGNKIYCNKNCYNTDIGGKFRRKAPGGFREGSGRAKTGYYQGIYCGSTYELAFLIWNLDNNIQIDRCKDSFDYEFENKNHKYYPDFVIDNKIYEIKGRISPVDFVKIQVAGAILIDKDQMKSYIEYVSEKHNLAKNNLWKLYDIQSYKNCLSCNKEFIPSTKTNIYCSNVCSMKENRKLSKKYGHIV